MCASCRPHSSDADRPHCPVPCKSVTHLSPAISIENHISLLHLCRTVCLCLQVRRAIQQMLFPTKAFNWLRHIAIALILLTFINMLVIFAPNILGIFGIIGKSNAVSSFHPRPNVKTHEHVHLLFSDLFGCRSHSTYSAIMVHLLYLCLPTESLTWLNLCCYSSVSWFKKH